MIGRVLIISVCLALGLVATLAQLDRQTRLSPGLAPLVPDSFSANAARERSKLALKLAQGEAAIAEARLGAALRPMPAESLTVLALSALQAGDESLARDALGAASRRGWREPVSQLASGEAAFEQGEYDIAAQRTVAMLSTGNLSEGALNLLARLVATPEGRSAMAERFAAYGRWQDNTINAASANVGPVDWASTLAEASEAGAKLNCNRLRPLIEGYRSRGEVEAAVLIKPLLSREACSAT